MKVSVLQSIARQIEGEYIMVKIVKAHVNPEKLYKFLRENELPRTMTQDGVNYYIEYGVLEDIEVEQNEPAL
jgi:hypothetical protein